MSSFNLNNREHLKSKMFLDPSGNVSIARFDKVKYPKIENITKEMIGLFWVPEEIELSQDRRDFDKLTEAEQHIFTSNLKRQTVLDSIQGRAPNVSFLPVTSIPEVEAATDKVCYDETIHSRSYVHIIRNVYNDPGEIFDQILDNPEIVKCAKSISTHYDILEVHNAKRVLQTEDYCEYEHKKAIYLALVAWNALEGLRFYVSFACSWAFAEMGQMSGNADIIKLIARDEERHRLLTQTMINILPKDDPDFKKIVEESKGEATQIYIDVCNQEKDWADYLFSKGGMIGLNAKILKDFITWLTSKRMAAINLDCPLKGQVTSNPLVWINSWLNSGAVQDAPQEKEKTSYLNGTIEQDLDSSNLEDIMDFDKLLKTI